MRKIYFSILMTGFLSAGVLHAQQDNQINSQFLSDADIASKLAGIENRNTSSNRGGMTLDCDSLLVEDAGGNEYNGNMFDIVVANEIYLETFSVSADAGSWNIAIFYRSGSYAGFNQTSTGWTFLDSAVITSTTTDAAVLYKVPVNVNLLLSPGTYGFYVTGMSGCPFNYSDGTAVGATAASNSDFSVLEGHGGAYPFNLTNSPRVFNGKVYYCVDVTGVEENLEEQFSVYPNPASSNLQIDLSAYAGKQVQLTLMNAVGQIVYNETGTATVMNIDVDAFSSGIYFVRAEIEGNVLHSKVVVE